MKIRYEQLTPREALEMYCDWIVSQLPKFRNPPFEWYFLFYPMRTLMLGAKLLNRPDYADAAVPSLNHYVEEQLPNGALTSNFRGQVADKMTQQDMEDLLRSGKLNLADNGSNVHGLIQAAVTVSDPALKERYLAAAKKWLDCWAPIWGLPNGAYGNGIWNGHKLNAPYSMAINVCSALAAYTLVTGDRHYIRNAERFAMFQCDNWHESGVPVRFNVYPKPDSSTLVGDFGRIFYLIEGLCWTHYVSNDTAVRDRIAERLTQWFENDLLKRWPDNRNWFDMNKSNLNHIVHDGFGDSWYDGIRFYWQASKACGVPSFFSYYDKFIKAHALLHDRAERGGKYLSNPLNARMLAIMADDVEPDFCMQATGFGGLTVAEAMEQGSTFTVFGTPTAADATASL